MAPDTDIEMLLVQHARLYPLMQAQDFAKLLFQRFMGPGHLVESYETALDGIRAERPSGENGVWLEDIGNGLCRCHMAGGRIKMSDEELAERFFLSAGRFVPDKTGLAGALDCIPRLAQAGLLPLSPEDARRFLDEYTAAGCPMTRHSQVYRDAYRPMYRVIFLEDNGHE